MIEKRDPEFYLLTAAGGVEQEWRDGEGTDEVRNVDWGRGVHRVPWLFPNDLCVEDSVREILMKHDSAGLLDCTEMRVVE